MTLATRPLRVLLVEDDPGDAKLLAIALAESAPTRYQLVSAATMADGLKRLDEGPRFDVVLLDLSLPDTRGEATVTRMRQAAPDLPIVIMTGLDDAAFAERMVGLGSQDYLVKGEANGPMVWRAIRYAIARMQQAIEREALVADLRTAVEMKNRMLGVLAHDLRNPLGAIGGYAELMEISEANLSPKGGEALRNVAEAVQFMDRLIDDVLTMAVVDAGDVTLVRQRVDLAAIARKAIDLCSAAAEKKEVRLALDMPSTWVHADAVKLEQVLNNLIGNAVKFSSAGGEVTVAASSDGEVVHLSVSDKGVGISPETMAGLFKPFVKGQPGTAGERSNGLGLYICLRIVEAHGGSIKVDSHPGEGTTFTVVLPTGWRS